MSRLVNQCSMEVSGMWILGRLGSLSRNGGGGAGGEDKVPHKEEKLAPHRVGRAGGKGPGDGSAMQAKKVSFDCEWNWSPMTIVNRFRRKQSARSHGVVSNFLKEGSRAGSNNVFRPDSEICRDVDVFGFWRPTLSFHFSRADNSSALWLNCFHGNLSGIIGRNGQILQQQDIFVTCQKLPYFVIKIPIRTENLLLDFVLNAVIVALFPKILVSYTIFINILSA